MKRHERVFTVLAALCVLMTACTPSESGSASPDSPTATESATSETPATEPTTSAATPTVEPTAAPEVTDQQLIAAALADYEADPQPEGTIAWDVIDSSVFEDLVSFTMCTWDGQTATDVIRDVKFVTTVDDTGTIETRNVQASPTSGDCLNTQLINSAIATVNAHDEYWRQVLLAPETFASDPTGLQIFTRQAHLELTEFTTGLVSDGVYFKGSYPAGLPESALAALAWRRYQNEEGVSVIALATCREMDDEYGLYRAETRIDDFRSSTSAGLHNILEYELVANSETPTGWSVNFTDGEIWGDCFATGDWLEAVNLWKPDPSPWDLLSP